MTPQPPDIDMITAAYCPHHGYAEYICVKCSAEREKQAVSADLALVKEVQDLRAENARLRREKSAMRAVVQVAVDTIEDHRNKVEMPPVLYNALTHIVLVATSALDKDGGAS